MLNTIILVVPAAEDSGLGLCRQGCLYLIVLMKMSPEQYNTTFDPLFPM